ncbi:MAG: hypothetical protein WDW36_000157 [Sanguina aurantia]
MSAPEPTGEPAVELQIVAAGAAKGQAHVAQKGVYEIDDHMLSKEEVIEKYKVGVDLAQLNHSFGLSSAAVLELRATHGLNQLSPPYEIPAWLQFLKQFTNPLMMLLLVAGLLTFMAYGIQSPRDKNNLILAVALLVVVGFTCTMSFLQERGRWRRSLRRTDPPRRSRACVSRSLCEPGSRGSSHSGGLLVQEVQCRAAMAPLPPAARVHPPGAGTQIGESTPRPGVLCSELSSAAVSCPGAVRTAHTVAPECFPTRDPLPGAVQDRRYLPRTEWTAPPQPP